MSLLTSNAVQAGYRSARVDLLPPEIGQARKAQTFRLGLLVAFAAVLGASAAACAITFGHVSTATDALENEQAKTAGLQAQQRTYAEVPKVLNEVQELTTAQRDLAASDIPLYSYVDSLAVGAPEDLSLKTVAFIVGSQGTNASTATSPLAVTGVGTVSITGETTNEVKVADWMDHVATIPGLTDSVLNTSTADATTGVVNFTSNATLTDAALSSAR